jgi:hypothetical protein
LEVQKQEAVDRACRFHECPRSLPQTVIHTAIGSVDDLITFDITLPPFFRLLQTFAAGGTRNQRPANMTGL